MTSPTTGQTQAGAEDGRSGPRRASCNRDCVPHRTRRHSILRGGCLAVAALAWIHSSRALASPFSGCIEYFADSRDRETRSGTSSATYFINLFPDPHADFTSHFTRDPSLQFGHRTNADPVLDESLELFSRRHPLSFRGTEQQIHGFWIAPSPLPARLVDDRHLELDLPDGFSDPCEGAFTAHQVCSLADRLFFQTFFEPSTAPIRGYGMVLGLRGVGVVGLLKMEGEKTFLALRTIVNSKGEYLLIAGGIYSLSRNLQLLAAREFDLANAFRHDPPRPPPHRILFNQMAVAPRRFAQVEGFFPDLWAMSRSQDRQYVFSRTDHQIHWPRFLRLIDRVRTQLEREWRQAGDAGL